MDTIRDILSLNSEPESASQARATSETFIADTLRQYGMENESTVGHGVMAAINTIRVSAGEHGARAVDQVFTNPDMVPYYLVRSDDPNAAQAHQTIAQAELSYWQQEHRNNPTNGTRIATRFGVAERVRFQETFGQLRDATQQFQSNYAAQQDFAQPQNPTAYYAQSSSPAPGQSSSAAAPSASGSTHRNRHQQHQQQGSSGQKKRRK